MDEEEVIEILESDSAPQKQTGNASPEVLNNTSNASLDESNPKKRERSIVWDHFTKFTDKGLLKCKCNYCSMDYKCDPSRIGTSTLRAHLGRCRTSPLNPRNFVDSKQSQISFQVTDKDKEATIGFWKFDQSKCRKALAIMVVADELPFAFVEYEGFRNFCQEIQPQFRIPSRRTVARDCYELFEEERMKLKQFLKTDCQRVCLTTDTWTSIQNINYLCLTAHFIDNDWKLQKKVLNFCPISSHKGEAIGRVVEKCLLSWNIDKVLTVTVDNASSNDLAVDYIRKRVNIWKGSVLKGECMQVRCVAHTMNLVSKDGLSLASESVERVRNAVKYVRQSPARLQKFKQCALDEKIELNKSLLLDVPTRWNSTFLMLDVARGYQKAFERYEELDANFLIKVKEGDLGPPTDVDWEKVNELVKVLETFYILTLRVSGSLYTTSNIYFHEVSNVDCLLKSCANDDFSLMASKMRKKYEKYWGDPEKLNIMMFIGAILDPRYKLEFVEFGIFEVYEEDKAVAVCKKVRDTLNALFVEYKTLYSKSSDTGDDLNLNTTQGQNSKQSTIANSRIHALFKKHKAEKESGLQNKSELDKYLSDAVEDDDDGSFDILSWWKANSLKFPILSRVARDVLAIPISTVASESTFSTGGRVLDPFRSSLTPKIVEALICTQDWLRKSSSSSVCVEEIIDVVEKLEKDFDSLKLKSHAKSHAGVIEVDF